MESSTAAPESTGSRTIADMMALAAEKLRRPQRGHVQARRRVGRGVLPRGRRDRLRDRARADRPRAARRASGRPSCARPGPSGRTRASASRSAGGVVVPIYPTNSPEECEWVAGNSESRFIVCEDASQVAKIAAVRDRLPALEAMIVIDPAGDVGDAISLDELRERGRGRDAAEVAERAAAVSPDDPYTFIYTSGTTGPPKGCVLAARQLPLGRRHVREGSRSSQDGDVVYLYLPLAHSFALLIELIAIDLGGTIAYWGGDPKGIVGELMAGQAALPAVGPADLREDLHAGHVDQRPGEDQGRDAARPEGPAAAGGRPADPGRSSRRRSTRPTRSCTPTSATCSAAGCGRRRAARRRSRRRSSSSSTRAACRCSRATG